MTQVDPKKFFEEYAERRKFTPPEHVPSQTPEPINRDSFGRINASTTQIEEVLKRRDELLCPSNRQLRRLERAARSHGGLERRG
jgi:hypothetical protein